MSTGLNRRPQEDGGKSRKQMIQEEEAQNKKDYNRRKMKERREAIARAWKPKPLGSYAQHLFEQETKKFRS